MQTQQVSTKLSFSDVISITDFSREQIETILQRAKQMEEIIPADKQKILKSKVIASLFFEPSTRTRLSFETAIHHLGASVIGFADANVSSTSKGETLSDTIRMVSAYADAIVMRHPLEGVARRAAEISDKPIINAGDGANQHPTQTLLDLYTIQKEFGKVDGLTISLVGDLKYGRTVHSLLQAANLFDDVNIQLVSPPSLAMPSGLIQEARNVNLIENVSLSDAIANSDVLYMTRIQKERFVDELEYKQVKNAFVLSAKDLLNAQPTLKILHPLPRVNEIQPDVDETTHAAYFRQAQNGVPVREALLAILLEES